MGVFVEEEAETFSLRNARHAAPIRGAQKCDTTPTMAADTGMDEWGTVCMKYSPIAKLFGV